jgi:hypothetical protein
MTMMDQIDSQAQCWLGGCVKYQEDQDRRTPQQKKIRYPFIVPEPAVCLYYRLYLFCAALYLMTTLNRSAMPPTGYHHPLLHPFSRKVPPRQKTRTWMTASAAPCDGGRSASSRHAGKCNHLYQDHQAGIRLRDVVHPGYLPQPLVMIVLYDVCPVFLQGECLHRV